MVVFDEFFLDIDSFLVTLPLGGRRPDMRRKQASHLSHGRDCNRLYPQIEVAFTCVTSKWSVMRLWVRGNRPTNEALPDRIGASHPLKMAAD
jgi:hypothetical protein